MRLKIKQGEATFSQEERYLKIKVYGSWEEVRTIWDAVTKATAVLLPKTVTWNKQRIEVPKES